MHLKEIQIKNFRGIRELTLPLGSLCILIGENNSGKSSILDAIQICLSKSLSSNRQPFDDYDYHLESSTSDPEKSPPIEITMTFSEIKIDEWDTNINRIFDETVQADPNGKLRTIIVRVTSQFDATSNAYDNKAEFLTSKGDPLNVSNLSQTFYGLRQFVPHFHLDSLRNAASAFRASSQFWKPFLSSPTISDKERESFEQSLQELNQAILNKHTSFESIKEHLGKTSKYLPLGSEEPVTIEAVPTRIFDVLSRTQVLLEAKTGAHIPIIRHGSGTQSFAVICLLAAFMQNKLEKGNGNKSYPIVTLEEPEAHLHPFAVQIATQMLEELPGQKIVTTHSGDLLANVKLQNIHRLSKVDGKVTAFRIKEGTFNAEEIGKLEHHIRNTRGELLYSRCWILVEGKSDVRILSDCSQALACNLPVEGISFVEMSVIGAEVVVKLANQLGIEWVLVVDGDSEGDKYKKSVKNHLNSRSLNDRVFQLEHKNMELYLCMEGYGDLYKNNVSPQKKHKVKADSRTADYWTSIIEAQKDGFKTRMATLVGEKIIRTRKVPKQLRDIINQSIDLARSTR